VFAASAAAIRITENLDAGCGLLPTTRTDLYTAAACRRFVGNAGGRYPVGTDWYLR
jgi:hypothetical protein